MKRNLFFGLLAAGVLAAGVLLAGCDDKGPVGVDSLTMRGTLILEVGNSSSLWATIQPPEAAGRQILYFVEDPTVATYDETTREVTALTPGITKIGASAGGKTVVCEVRVIPEIEDILDRIVDSRFRDRVRSEMRNQSNQPAWDENGDGKLSPVEATRVEVLDLSGLGITTLEGIEIFPALRSLNCSDNALTGIDFSMVRSLQSLNCDGNRFETLDVTSLKSLSYLSCRNMPIVSLDATGCSGLASLDVDFTSMKTLNVSGTALTRISHYRGELTSFDASNCRHLASVWLGNNKLTSLDVSNCPALTSLGCYGNRLTELDVTGSPLLTELECSDNLLTSLDLSRCLALTDLMCGNNALTGLDLSGMTKLVFLAVSNNALTGIDISDCTGMHYFSCVSNPGIDEVFTVRAWFDDDNIPNGPSNISQSGEIVFSDSWEYQGRTVRANYQKVI